MDDMDVHLGLYIIVVLCLIVIAMSNYRLAYGDEYMSNCYAGDTNASSMRFATELSGAGNQTKSCFAGGSGGNEPPVFWNIGSVEDTNEALQAAVKQTETNNQYVAPAKSYMQGGAIPVPY
jgi:hypothetical protein